MELFLVRHTAVDIAPGTCYGQHDVALDSGFPEELQTIQSKLDTKFDKVYSSPLSRCVSLAKGLGFEKLELDHRLMEMHFGDWENMKWDEMESSDLNHWMENFVDVCTPNGESLTQLHARVREFIEELRIQKLKRVLIISHAGVIRCICAMILGVPLYNIFKLSVQHGQIIKIKLGQQASNDLLIQL